MAAIGRLPRRWGRGVRGFVDDDLEPVAVEQARGHERIRTGEHPCERVGLPRARRQQHDSSRGVEHDLKTVAVPTLTVGGYYDQDVYFITPNHFLPNLHDPGFLDPLRRMDITLAVGEHDPFHESNRVLSQSLAEKGVSHRFAVWPGEAHRARYWREMVQQYL